jgi:hypothetical protein
LALAVDFALGLAAGFPATGAAACKEARRARFRSRLAACERLRVFSRALSFGIVRLLLADVVSYEDSMILSNRFHPTLFARHAPVIREIERKIAKTKKQIFEPWKTGSGEGLPQCAKASFRLSTLAISATRPGLP